MKNQPESRKARVLWGVAGKELGSATAACLFLALGAPLAAQSFSTANASPSAQIAPDGGEEWEDDEPAEQRFFPAVWISVDLETRRMMADQVDPGTLIRFWSLGSTVRGAQNVFGPVVGLRTVGFGWLWRFRDGSFHVGLSGVVETERLFDRTKPLTIRPAVTLSYAGGGKQ